MRNLSENNFLLEASTLPNVSLSVRLPRKMNKLRRTKRSDCHCQFRRLCALAASASFILSLRCFSDRIGIEINAEQTARKITSFDTWGEDDFVAYIKEAWMLVLVDPAPTEFFFSRFGKHGEPGSWERKGYLQHVNLTFEEKFSTDASLLGKYPDGYFDFIYLDALHTHEAVKTEIFTWWKKVRPGGILAGHDYCNYGEEGLSCIGCNSIPACGPYTRDGVESAESKRGRSSNQQGVVMAVQEWMLESGDSSLAVHHTVENFTRDSLAHDGFDYDMVVRRDRNPSWFIVKPWL